MQGVAKLKPDIRLVATGRDRGLSDIAFRGTSISFLSTFTACLAMKKFMTMQTGLEELTEKAQRQTTEGAAQVKEATGAAGTKALRIAEAAWYDAKTKAASQGFDGQDCALLMTNFAS